MRKACWIWLVAITLGSVGVVRAEEKPMLPPGSVPLDDLKSQAAKQQMGKPIPKPMTQSRSGVGDFFRRLFGPSEPKINGTIISGAQTYRNGILPVAPVLPR